MADLRITKEAQAAAAAAASEEKAEQDREMDAMFEAAADVAASGASSPMGTRRSRFDVGGDRAVALAIAEDEAMFAAFCTPGSSTLDATEAGRQTSSEPSSFRQAGSEGEARGDGSFSSNTLRRRRDSAAASFSSPGPGSSASPKLRSMGSVKMQGMLRRGSEEAIEHAGQLEPWTAVGGGAVQVGDNAMWQMPDQAEINVSGDAALVIAARRLWHPPPPAQQEWWLSPAAGTGTYAPPPSDRIASPGKGGVARSAREVAVSLLDMQISAAVANAVAAAQPACLERRVSLTVSIADSIDSVERSSPLKAAQMKMEEEEDAQQKIQAAYQARAARKRVAAKTEAEGKVGTPAARRGSGAHARKEMGEKAAARRAEAKAQAEAEAEGKTGAELRKRAASKERLGRQTALGAQGYDESERADAMETLATGVRGRKARVEVRELREAKKEAHRVAEVDAGGVERMEARLTEGKLLSTHEVKSLRHGAEVELKAAQGKLLSAHEVKGLHKTCNTPPPSPPRRPPPRGGEADKKAAAARPETAEEEKAREKIQAAARGRAARKHVAVHKVEMKAKQGKQLNAHDVQTLREGVEDDKKAAAARRESVEEEKARQRAEAAHKVKSPPGSFKKKRAAAHPETAEEEKARETIQAAARGHAGRKKAGAQKVEVKAKQGKLLSAPEVKTLRTGVDAEVEVKAAQGKLLSAPEVKALHKGVDADTRVKTEQGKLLSAPEVTRLRKECAEAERLAAPMVQKHVRGQQARKEVHGKRHGEHHSGERHSGESHHSGHSGHSGHSVHSGERRPSHSHSLHGSPARAPPPRNAGPPSSPLPRAESPARTPVRAHRGSKDVHAKLAEQVDAEAEEIDRLWARQADGKHLSMHEEHMLKDAREADEAAAKHVLDAAVRASSLRPEVSAEEKARLVLQAAARGRAGRKRHKAHKAAQPAGVKAARRASEALMKAGHILPPPAVEPPMAVQPGSRLPRQVWLLPPAERRADESAALVAWLRGVPLLREMDEEVLAALAAKAPVAHVSAGQVLYRAAGCDAQCFLLLSGGVAEVIRDEDEYGEERFRLLRASGAGHCVGYGSLHLEGEADGARGATAVTTEATEAVVMPRRLLEKETRIFTRRLLERKMHILQARRTHAYTDVTTHACTYTHARTHAHAHTHTHAAYPNPQILPPPTLHPTPAQATQLFDLWKAPQLAKLAIAMQALLTLLLTYLPYHLLRTYYLLRARHRRAGPLHPPQAHAAGRAGRAGRLRAAGGRGRGAPRARRRRRGGAAPAAAGGAVPAGQLSAAHAAKRWRRGAELAVRRGVPHAGDLLHAAGGGLPRPLLVLVPAGARLGRGGAGRASRGADERRHKPREGPGEGPQWCRPDAPRRPDARQEGWPALERLAARRRHRCIVWHRRSERAARCRAPLDAEAY